MIFQAPVSRQDVEMLVGSHKAFAAKNMQMAAELLMQNKPMKAVTKAYDDAGDHLSKAEKWSVVLAEMDRPDAQATDGELVRDISA